MDTSKSTPRPWKVRAPKPARYPDYTVETIDGHYVASVSIMADNPAHANAALIVRAVNCHDELVAALQLVLDAYPEHACFATGPMTGDAIRDLVACPGCAADRAVRAALLA